MAGFKGTYHTAGIVIWVVVPSGLVIQYINTIKKHAVGARLDPKPSNLVNGTLIEIIFTGIMPKIEEEIFKLTDKFFRANEIKRMENFSQLEA